MAADQFCLRWNNFQINITSALESLKSDEDLVDVTLTCDGQNVKAHKVILSACSPYFRNVFKENPCQHPVVILKDVKYEDVQALLSFMYQGEVYISQERLAPFLHTAELLQVRGLAGAANPFRDSQQQPPQSVPPPPPLPPSSSSPPPPPPSTVHQTQPSVTPPKLRKPLSLPSIPPPVTPLLQTHIRPNVQLSPVHPGPEQPAAAPPEMQPPVSVSPTLSQPSSPIQEDIPIPLSKRRKAFPRRFPATSVPHHLSSIEDYSTLSQPAMAQPSSVVTSPLPELPITVKKEPLSLDDGAGQDERTMKGINESGSPSLSGTSEEVDCFGSSVGDEDSRGVPLKDESWCSSPPEPQQPSMLMRSLSGAPPPHTAVSEDRNCSWDASSDWPPQPIILTPRQIAVRNAYRRAYHLRKHAWQSRQPVNCPNCHRVISMAHNLKPHMITCLRRTSNCYEKTDMVSIDNGWTTL